MTARETPAVEASVELRALLERVLAREDLDAPAAERALALLAAPDAARAQQAALLVALRAKGETAVELEGFARGLLARARGPIVVPSDTVAGDTVAGATPLVDTCGTGGDGTHSFNLSSATALLVAALGVRVAKHGNRSVSSRSGSADLFEALGVPFANEPEHASRALAAHGFAFLFAPSFHPALAALAPVRRELGVRTLFNLLGPLVNPARPTHQLIGAPSPTSARLLAHAAHALGTTRSFVVHGNGFDEATPCGPFLVLEVTSTGVAERTLDPRAFGCERCTPAELAGGDAHANAAQLRRLFRARRTHGDPDATTDGQADGKERALRAALCLNAALVLLLVEREREPRAAMSAAAAALDDGRAQRFLSALVQNGEAR